MNTKDQHIFFTSNEVLSSEEIKRYVLGKMSKMEKHQVELLMESNPFLADAIEGYQEFPKSLGTLNKKPYSPKSGSALIWSIFGGLLLMALSFWYFNKPENNTKLVKSEAIPTEIQKTKITQNMVEQPTIVIVDSHYSDSSIQVTSQRSKNENKITISQEKFAQGEEKTVLPLEEPKPINTNKIIDSIATKTNKKEIEKNKIFDIYHIVDYTVYDYRGKREEPIKILAPITSGTPANQANKNSKVDEPNPTTKIYYDVYLKESIILFSKQNYKQASKKFKTILKKYPEDVNALFYKSMCSYNRKKHKQAVVEFKKYLNQSITLFDEDATFFLAISLREIGEEKEATILFNTIIKEKGFYKKQAEDLLKK